MHIEFWTEKLPRHCFNMNKVITRTYPANQVSQNMFSLSRSRSQKLLLDVNNVVTKKQILIVIQKLISSCINFSNKKCVNKNWTKLKTYPKIEWFNWQEKEREKKKNIRNLNGKGWRSVEWRNAYRLSFATSSVIWGYAFGKFNWTLKKIETILGVEKVGKKVVEKRRLWMKNSFIASVICVDCRKWV